MIGIEHFILICDAKPTSEPVHDQLVGFDLLAYAVLDLEKRYRSVNQVAVSIQGFTPMFPFVCMQDLDEAIRPMLGVRELLMELLDGLLEIRSVDV